jgi:sortase A
VKRTVSPLAVLSAPATRHRRGSGSIARALSTVLILTGALLIADAAVTVLWQEPVSALYSQLRQNSLGGELAALERQAPSPLEVTALGHMRDQGRRIAFLARELERRSGEGSAVGRIRISRIGANFVIVKGTSTADLRGGPGIYPQTRFPGVPGTTAIAGHRTTYLAPFRHIDQLRNGDRIELDMPYAHFTYAVDGTRIVTPTDIAVIDPVGYDRVVLSACTPLYSAAKRIVVFARLVATQPLGPARVGFGRLAAA